MNVLFFIVVMLAAVLAILWKREPRSMLNAGVFGLLLAFTYLLLMELTFRSGWGGGLYSYLTIFLFLGLPLLYLIGSLLLVLNGRTMIRNEGLSLSHMLAPLVGSIPILLLLAGVGLVILQFFSAEEPTAFVGGVLGVVLIAYGYAIWLAYFTIPYGALYTLAPKKKDVDFIIVHGSGLIDGNVPPLLESRLEKAIEVYNAGGGRATIITSGGQGDDEPRAEADAMADYLLERGLPAELIVPEDQSATTYENMTNSKMIIERRSQRPATAVFVTSNYHVFRTALIARKVGLNAQGIGSRTASYYLPSAIIREFIAITVMYKWWHIVPVLLIGALALLPLVAELLQ